MHFKRTVLAAGLLQTGMASPISERQVVDTPCHNVHVFVARGSYEDYTLGGNRQDNLLVPEICKGRGSCGYEDIVYDATIGDNYCGSETGGVNAGLQQLKSYVKRCPQSKIVLTGYSQGAQVVGDMLGGSGGGNTCDAGNGPLSPNNSPGNKIKAITLFGDTRRTPGQGYNKGSAGVDANGAFPRSGAQLDGFNKYAGKIQSYCTALDTWCASGGNDDVHAHEVEDHHKAAAKFINSKL